MQGSGGRAFQGRGKSGSDIPESGASLGCWRESRKVTEWKKQGIVWWKHESEK